MITKPHLYLVILLLTFSSIAISQKVSVTGKLTGEIAKMVKEVQFICDGSMQKLTVNKQDLTFTGDIKIKVPQFVEINAGNPKPQSFYLVPNEKLIITIDKPSLHESGISISNDKVQRLQEIFLTYYHALEEKGVNIKIRDWEKLLFVNNTPIDYAETKLNAALEMQKQFAASVPNFISDMKLFSKSFRRLTEIDTLSLQEIEKTLSEIKAANTGITAITIPFYKDYLTDLTNGYAALTLQKYGISHDAIKQKQISQFIAAEAISKYIPSSKIRSYLFSEKLKVELPVNGLKNETYANYLYDNSEQFVKDLYKDKINLLRENKMPDLNAARKKAFDFLLHDSTGKEYRLADFKGKMLFIDFWASWCAPCKAQIPYQKELEKQYAGKDILFVSVSLDKSKVDWLKAVKEEDLHGYILHAKGDFKNDFPKAYGVESIPRYMLIDAAGNIISDNMIKPQNKKEITGIIGEELFAKNTNSILEKHFLATGGENLKNNGVEMKYRQSVMTIASSTQLWYRYPYQFKMINQVEETEQMRMIVGKDLFKELKTVMNGDSVTTNSPSNADIKDNWIGKLYGLELFLRKNLYNSSIKFSEENSNTSDSNYVLKLINKGNIEKYYINKKTFLIDKIVTIAVNQKPRNGGGTFESFVTYDDYRNVNGVMFPFKINMANVSNIRIEKAEVKPIPESVFH